MMTTSSIPDPELSRRKKVFQWLKQKWRVMMRSGADNSLRETIEELIEDTETEEANPSIELDERLLLGNVLNLRDRTAEDAMVPRVDIIAVPITTTGSELLAVLTRSRHSRLPVYRTNLDDVIGMVDIKDVLGWVATKKPLNIKAMVRDVIFVSPTMRTLDLLFQMRESGTKMAMVVDEFGGIDGLVTFPDLIEEIIGDIQDAQGSNPIHQLVERADGSILADARVTLEQISENYGVNLIVEGMEDDIDTLGGLVVALAGRVPARGELITHPAGLEVEVVDADPRRVKRLYLRGIQKLATME
ncbi:MAG: putative hemolysin containing domain [Alphaproteobacteria bacterium]|jgi:CBS domain containing-hemolysin-like protein|nr:putative hemolysin containing domain [Alphaproteobacteria bacterium]